MMNERREEETTHGGVADIESHVELLEGLSQLVAVSDWPVDPPTQRCLHVQEIRKQHWVRHQGLGIPSHLQQEKEGRWGYHGNSSLRKELCNVNKL